MMGGPTKAISLGAHLLILVSVGLVQHVLSDEIAILEQEQPINHADLSSEEFRLWIEEQENKVVYKIMEKISSPNDTSMQHAAKIAVAKYLVNVTFTAMTRRLETLKSGKKQGFISEPQKLPASAVYAPETTTELIMMQESADNESVSVNDTTVATTSPSPDEIALVFAGGNETNNDTVLPTSFLPTSFGVSQSLPLSSTLEEQSTSPTTSMNETETTNAPSGSNRPIWEEILTFNFSDALMGGGGANNLLNRIRGGGSGGGEGGGLLSRLNLTSLGGGSGGEGGSFLSRLNLTSLGGGSGGEGGGFLSRLNLSSLGGGEGGGLFSRLNLTSLGGGGGGSGGNLFDRLNISLPPLGASAGSEGRPSIFTHFNFSALRRPTGGQGANSTNTTRTGGLPFNLAPPEGLFNYPTPPPMNDSVRMAQMQLGNQVEKLMGDINNTNLTGIVESTLNIATPSTVGVLVNALLNILLCNPLDRFHGNCGIE